MEVEELGGIPVDEERGPGGDTAVDRAAVDARAEAGEWGPEVAKPTRSGRCAWPGRCVRAVLATGFASAAVDDPTMDSMERTWHASHGRNGTGTSRAAG